MRASTRPRRKVLSETERGDETFQIISIAGVRSFCIDDILSHKTAALQRGKPGIVRPWDHSEEEAESQEQVAKPRQRGKSNEDSPLDALFNMASNFEALKAKSGV